MKKIFVIFVARGILISIQMTRHGHKRDAKSLIATQTVLTDGMVPHNDVIKKKRFPRYRPFVRGIHRSPTEASDAELWSTPEQTAEQTIKTLVIWDAVALIMTSL